MKRWFRFAFAIVTTGAWAAPALAQGWVAPICQEVGDQWFVNAVADGAGGAYFVWLDTRNGTNYVYVQRLTNSGTPAPGWPACGIQASTSGATPGRPEIIRDDSCGAVVLWRSASSALAQRITPLGRIATGWPASGLSVVTGSAGDVPVMIGDGVGGAIVVWSHNALADIYARRFSFAGSVTWGPVALSPSYEDHIDPVAVADGQGGAIVAWQDYRNYILGKTPRHADIYAQRVRSNGTTAWGTSGVELCRRSEDQVNPAIASDGAGGAIVVWEDYWPGGAESDLYAERVTAQGAVLWGIAPVTQSTGDQTEPRLVSDREHGAIVVWTDAHDPADQDIYAVRIDESGDTMNGWIVGGTAVCGDDGNDQFDPQIVEDGFGGAIMAWVDQRNGYDIYALRMTAAGNRASSWNLDGDPMSTGRSSQFALTTDGVGGAIVGCRRQNQVPTPSDAIAGRHSPTAALSPIWPEHGRGVSVIPGGYLRTEDHSEYFRPLVTDACGGAILAWHENRYDAARTTAMGEIAGEIGGWPPGGRLLSSSTYLAEWAAAPDGEGGAFVTWIGYGPSGVRLYIQRVLHDGAIAPDWNADGMVVSTNIELSSPFVRIVADGCGSAIIVWMAEDSLRVQRVTPYATTTWRAGGLGVDAAHISQMLPAYGGRFDLVSDGAGGTIVVWANPIGPAGSVRAKRVRADGGAFVWSVALQNASDRVERLRAVGDGAGGAIAVWIENSPVFTLRAQRVSAAGATGAALGWPAAGALLGSDDAISIEALDAIADGAGGAIVAWMADSDLDGDVDTDIFAQRVSASGALGDGWPAGGMPVSITRGAQRNPSLATDGRGGAFLAWEDNRLAGAPNRPASTSYLYMTRLNEIGGYSSGWRANGGSLARTNAGNQLHPALVSDCAGGCIVAWTDHRDGVPAIYAKRVSADGHEVDNSLTFADSGSFRGLIHGSLGQATLGSSGVDLLEVANIGANGQDGVEIVLPDSSRSMMLGIALPDSTPIGARLEVTSASPDSFSSRATKGASGIDVTVVKKSGGGIASWRFSRNDTTVYEFTAPADSIGFQVRIPTWPSFSGEGCRARYPATCANGLVWSWPSAQSMLLRNRPGKSDSTILADQMAAIVDGEGAPPIRLRLLAANLTAVGIVRETNSLVYGGLEHGAVGSATLHGNGDSLYVGGLIDLIPGGVHIDLPDESDIPDSGKTGMAVVYDLPADDSIANGSWLEWSGVVAGESNVPAGHMRMTKSGPDQWQITSDLTAHSEKRVAVYRGGFPVYGDVRPKAQGIVDAITPHGSGYNDQDPGLLSPLFLRSRYAGTVPITVVNRPGGAPDTTVLGDELRVMEPTWENDTTYVFFSGFDLVMSGIAELTIVAEETQVTAVPRGLPGPIELAFAPPSPNPATRPVAALGFRLGEAAEVGFELLDVAGRRVASRVPQMFAPGVHRIEWNTGLRAPGLYFVRLRTERGHVAVQRWVILR